MEPRLVSAIVVNLNGGTELDDSLQSLLAQTYANLEIVLIDNGSTDGSGDAAAEKYGERIRYLANATNLGFAKGNNQAFEIATGDWFFLLNNDATADPEAVAECMAFIASRDEDEKIGQLACRVMVRDKPNVFDSAGLLVYPDGVCRPRGWEEKDMGQYDRVEEVLAPHGCAAMYRRTMIDEVGAFDEAFFAYLEDLDLGFRGQLCGWKCWYVPTSIARHQKSMTFGNYSSFKAYHVERNRIYCAVRLLPRFILFVSPLFTLNRYLLQGYAVATHRGLSSEFVKEYSWWQLIILLIRAYSRAFTRLPSLLMERRRLSKIRTISTEEWYQLISRFKLDAIELALKC